MDNLVYHYTSIEAMKLIVTNDICFWATRYDHLNDPHEQIWAKEFAQKYCCNESDEESRQRIATFFTKYSYILCFCDIPDYRNMWRLYCNDGIGVCLGVDSDILKQKSIENSITEPSHKFDIFRNVEYALKEEISKKIEILEKDAVFGRMEEYEENMMNMCVFIKDKDFDVEWESRYARIRGNNVINCFLDPEKQNEIKTEGIENKEDVKYRLRGANEIVPYLDIHFPHEALKRIIIGYKYNKVYKKVKEIIKSHLDEYGDIYKKVEIIESSLY